MSTVRIQVRRGIAADWASVNPILAAGEMGVESDTNKFKFGNGSSTWTSLSYAAADAPAIGEISQDAINTALTVGAGLTKTYNDGANTITVNVDSDVVALKSYVDAAISGLSNTLDSDYISASDRGAANGVASLDADTKVPRAQLNISAGNNINVLNDPQTTALQIKLSDEISVTTSVSAPSVVATALEAETLSASSNASIGGNLTVDGNLTINGTTTTVDTANFTTADSMIYLGEDNPGNTVDLGIVSSFNDGTYQHSGLVRDASDGIWKLFSGVVAEPTNTVDFTTYTKDYIEVGGLLADAAAIGDVTNTEIQYLSGVSSNIQDQLNDKSDSSEVASLYAPKASPTFTGIVTLPNGTVVESALAADAVVTAKISDAAVAEAKIAANAVTSTKIADSAVIEGKIAANAVTSTKIADYAVTANKIQGGEIVDNHISATADIAPSKIDGVAVTQADTGTVTNAMLAGFIEQDKLSGEIPQDKIVSLESDLDAKAPIHTPTFTGTVNLPATTIIGSVDGTEIGYLNGVTSDIQTQFASAATALSNHESDTTNIHGIADTTALATKTYVDNAGTALQSNIDAKAPIANPTFTGTVAGVTKAHVGLGNVDNTSDANKPVSTATQTALDLKAPKAGPTFTGTLTAADMVVNGDLTINGTTFNASTTSITIEDNLVQLAHQNPANTVDLGIVVGYNDGSAKHSGLVRDVSDAKWKLFKGVTTEPTTTVDFTQGSLDDLAVAALTATTVTPSSGVVFSDGTQTKEGVPSRTPIIYKTASYTLSSLDERDDLIEVASLTPTTITIPANSAVAYPVGTSIDILQTSTGQVTIAAGAGVTVNATPGLKLRTQWSSCTLFKRATDTWVVMGDLTA